MRAVRLAFWLLYNPLAWTYDLVSSVVSLGQWREWQRAALAQVRGRRVLELAFGTGSLLRDLHRAGYDPIGIDLSWAMARLAQRKLRASQGGTIWGTGASLVQGRAQRMPFADASFDSLVCTFPSEFIVHVDTLAEAARVLRPGGRGVVVLGAHLLDKGLWPRVLEWLYRLTGQREALPDLSPLLASLGLEARIEHTNLSSGGRLRSTVVSVILEKQAVAQPAPACVER